MEVTKSILLVEDNPGDAKIIETYLNLHNSLLHPEIVHVDSLGGALAHLDSHSTDIILLDLRLPDSVGLDTFSRLKKAHPNFPYIVLTGSAAKQPGSVNHQLGLDAVKMGAQDFINKNDLIKDEGEMLVRAIGYAVQRHQLTYRLEQAQKLAKVGHWEVTFSNNAFIGSKEMYNILGIQEPNLNTLADYISRVVPEDQEKVVSKFLGVFKDGGELEVEHRIISDDSAPKYAILKGKTVNSADGKHKSIMGTTQDISERKRVEILKREKELIEESAKLKQDFLAKTSHEIRTPLNPILLVTNILLNSNPTIQQREHLNAIKTAGETLLAVVNDVLDLSKIEAGKIDFNHQVFRLQQVFSSLREMMELNAREKGLDLILDISPEIPEYLVGDNVRLTQVLLNLVNNAVKFTHKGYIRAEARLHSTKDKKARLLFSVSDTGIGIPPDRLNEIFESFKQIDGGINRRFQGTGLGLTICKQLIKLQGGEIYVKSDYGQGSTFTFELDFEISNDTDSNQLLKYPAERHNLEGIDILLVEDNVLNQLVTKKIINNWGANLDVVNNGKECIDVLEKKDYSLILMDLQMPEMNGYEATKYIREKMPSPKKEIPIIALTANAFSGMNDECMQIGMNDYVSKPFEPDHLNYKIAQHARTVKAKAAGIKMDMNHKESGLSENNINQVSSIQNSLPTNMGEPPYTDLTYLKGISMGDNTIVRKAIDRYLKDTPGLVDKMGEYLLTKDFDQLGKCAHKLKSSVAIMGMETVKNAMESIVVITRSNQSNNQELSQLIKGSQVAIRHSLVELEAALKEI